MGLDEKCAASLWLYDWAIQSFNEHVAKLADALFVGSKKEVEKGTELFEMAGQHPSIAYSQWYADVAD